MTISPKPTLGSRIAVIGSINLDLVAAVPHLPAAGETLQSLGFGSFVGGKALNQAVAVQRLGGQAVLVGFVGRDAYGQTVRHFLSDEGIDTVLLRAVDAPTGLSLISVDKTTAENTIVTVAGANLFFRPELLHWRDEPLGSCSAVMLHWDFPQSVGEAMLQEAKAAGKFVVLSLAPFGPIDKQALTYVDLLVVNEVEAAMLTGVAVQPEQPEPLLQAMAALGVRYPVVTMGAQGAAALVDGSVLMAKAPTVEAVDSVGAGDTFIGALVHFLSTMPWEQALEMAVAAASLSVTKPGAAASIPYHGELQTFLTANAGRP